MEQRTFFVIPQRNWTPIHKLKVAAYARVSSITDDSEHSLNAQVSFYNSYISEHPDWELVGIYADYGVSGTLENRPEFQRLMRDARAGQIELILTKSISRMARNVVTLLRTIRELKALGIGIYFERENIDTRKAEGELLLTALALYAEMEARSASENRRWGIRRHFQEGEFVGWTRIYGYECCDGDFRVIPEEAEVVKGIFNAYLAGKGVNRIAQELNQRGIPTVNGRKWSVPTLRYMLSNEKYIGDLLLQKSYISDFRTKLKRVNRGVLPQYLVRDSHEAIIERPLFDQVQAEITRRREIAQKRMERTGKSYSPPPNLYTGLLYCGRCHKRYAHQKNGAGTHHWFCPRRRSKGCDGRLMSELKLNQCTRQILGLAEDVEINRELLLNNFEKITLEQNKWLKYQFLDGSTAQVVFPRTNQAKGGQND